MKTYLPQLIFAFFFCSAYAQNGFVEFTESGLFTVPAGVTKITIEVVGAGGTGGFNGGGGGGGGGYASGIYSVNPLDVLSVTVGKGGGGAGNGTTNVETLISAKGGGNGTTVPNPNLGGGGNGGIASGGTIANYMGGKGGGGYYTYFGGGGGGAAGVVSDGAAGGNTIVWNGQNCLTPGGDGGISGGEPGGNGGKGAGFIDNFCSVTDPAANGNKWGGGGGGGNGNGGAPGNGAGGYCKISWDYATGIAELISHDQVLASSSFFSFFIRLMNTSGNETYSLINLQGQVMWRGKGIEKVDFSYLEKGNYLLQVFSNSSEQTIRLFKE